jgi:hypothetical protein
MDLWYFPEQACTPETPETPLKLKVKPAHHGMLSSCLDQPSPSSATSTDSPNTSAIRRRRSIEAMPCSKYSTSFPSTNTIITANWTEIETTMNRRVSCPEQPNFSSEKRPPLVRKLSSSKVLSTHLFKSSTDI